VLVDDSNYHETLDFIKDKNAALFLGITTVYCDYCLKMEEHIKRASYIMMRSEEKFFFGIYNIS
jgi:hypothetical protein